MSREIKFRAWSKFPKMFLDMSDACYYLLPFGKLVQITFDKRKHATHREIDTVVQLYTGLKDKHRTEIYEGDIIKFINKEGVEIISEVVFYDGAFELTNYDYRNCKDNSCVNCYELLKWVACDCEVIGNIYENSELLK